jgi:hypothetical protein
MANLFKFSDEQKIQSVSCTSEVDRDGKIRRANNHRFPATKDLALQSIV